jgi:hypothetical protein
MGNFLKMKSASQQSDVVPPVQRLLWGFLLPRLAFVRRWGDDKYEIVHLLQLRYQVGLEHFGWPLQRFQAIGTILHLVQGSHPEAGWAAM